MILSKLSGSPELQKHLIARLREKRIANARLAEKIELALIFVIVMLALTMAMLK